MLQKKQDVCLEGEVEKIEGNENQDKETKQIKIKGNYILQDTIKIETITEI